jgi:hypothetical protein
MRDVAGGMADLARGDLLKGAETLRRVAKQAERPARRQREEPGARSRHVPALPEEPAPGRAGRSRRSRPK